MARSVAQRGWSRHLAWSIVVLWFGIVSGPVAAQDTRTTPPAATPIDAVQAEQPPAERTQNEPAQAAPVPATTGTADEPAQAPATPANEAGGSAPADQGGEALPPTADGVSPEDTGTAAGAAASEPEAGAAPAPIAGDGIEGALPDDTLPRDLSPWAMFENADIVVKLVMIGLAFASLVTWTVWMVKVIELIRARRHLTTVAAALADVHGLTDLRHQTRPDGPGTALIAAGLAELDGSLDDPAAVKERIALRLARIEAAAARTLQRGTGVLATIGSTAPFVGLFGTVWGIMNSFIGISKAQTTNLAVVAPGIAEALLATALGLVAAIPAVVIYNLCARWIGSYRAGLADLSATVLRLASRQLSERAGPARRAAE